MFPSADQWKHLYSSVSSIWTWHFWYYSHHPLSHYIRKYQHLPSSAHHAESWYMMHIICIISSPLIISESQREQLSFEMHSSSNGNRQFFKKQSKPFPPLSMPLICLYTRPNYSLDFANWVIDWLLFATVIALVQMDSSKAGLSLKQTVSQHAKVHGVSPITQKKVINCQKDLFLWWSFSSISGKPITNIWWIVNGWNDCCCVVLNTARLWCFILMFNLAVRLWGGHCRTY